MQGVVGGERAAFVSRIIMRCKVRAVVAGNHNFFFNEVVRSGAISNRPGTSQEDSLKHIDTQIVEQVDLILRSTISFNRGGPPRLPVALPLVGRQHTSGSGRSERLMIGDIILFLLLFGFVPLHASALIRVL